MTRPLRLQGATAKRVRSVLARRSTDFAITRQGGGEEQRSQQASAPRQQARGAVSTTAYKQRLKREDGRWRIYVGIGEPEPDDEFRDHLRPIELMLVAGDKGGEEEKWTGWTAQFAHNQSPIRLQRRFLLHPNEWTRGSLVKGPDGIKVELLLVEDALPPRHAPWFEEHKDRSVAMVAHGAVVAVHRLDEALSSQGDVLVMPFAIPAWPPRI